MSYTETLTVVTCTCGINYAIPHALQEQLLREKRHKSVYCPLGHQWHYTGKTDAEIEQAKREQAEARALAIQDQLDAEKRAHASTKKRVNNGVCPHCHRTFAQLARHMKSKHPGALK